MDRRPAEAGSLCVSEPRDSFRWARICHRRGPLAPACDTDCQEQGSFRPVFNGTMFQIQPPSASQPSQLMPVKVEAAGFS